MSELAIGTILARNYLAYAKVLADSLFHYHPDVPLYIFVPDADGDELEFHNGRIRLLGFPDLEIGDIQSRLFAYNLKQLLVSVKPTLLRFLLEEGFSSVLFLDPDMLVLADLNEVFDQVSSHALTLTPHLHLATTRGNRVFREHTVLLAGIYNGGFIGVSDQPETHRFLAWWETRLHKYCYENLREGLHYDQRWLDLAPGFVQDLHLIRDSGINVAHWNLPDLKVERHDNALIINQQLCRLFHFSGYRPERPDEVTCYMPGLRTQDLGPAAFLFSSYLQRLKKAGFERTSQSPWPWDSFSNGVEITAIARERYRSLGEKVKKFKNPFDAEGKSSYFRWLTKILANAKSDDLSDEEFIRDCYKVYMDRQPSAGELAGLLSGAWSHAEVTTLFAEVESPGFSDRIQALFTEFSVDPTRNFVTKMYIGLLDRLVDSGGLEHFTWLLNTAKENGGIEAVRTEACSFGRVVLSSEEYLSKKPTNATHVIRLYRAYFGCFPTRNEGDYWSSELGAGRQTTDTLINEFAASTQFTTKLNTFF